MDQINTAFGEPARIIDAPPEPAHFTPGEFLRETGVIITVCLAFAMLAQVLVMLTGRY